MTGPASIRIVRTGESAAAQAVPAIDVKDLHVWFGQATVLREVNVTFQAHRINCIVGPSGSGKSTLIRSLNRINDTVAGYRCQGAVYVNRVNTLDRSIDVVKLRTDIGMVFQKPCVFPKSISANVLFGVQQQRRLSRLERRQLVEETLRSVSLWKEVSHRLGDKAGSLSVGQQQRLCIARTLAVQPKVILLDEPTSSLDPVSTRAIEDLMVRLKKDYTIIFVTHNIQQARRIADHLVFLCNGKVIEQGPKHTLFDHPQHEQTRRYLAEEYCDC